MLECNIKSETESMYEWIIFSNLSLMQWIWKLITGNWLSAKGRWYKKPGQGLQGEHDQNNEQNPPIFPQSAASAVQTKEANKNAMLSLTP